MATPISPLPDLSQYNYDIGDTVDVVTKQNAINAEIEALGQRINATVASINTEVQAVEDVAQTATDAATQAAESAQEASAIYPSVTQGLGATSADQFFKVPENGYLQLYRNSNGAAEPVFRLASEEALIKLNAQPDPLLTSLIF